MSCVKVKGITIPSIEECSRIPYGLMKYENRWWLRSAGQENNFVAVADGDGAIFEYGCQIGRLDISVRPALLLEESNLPNGWRFNLYGKEWEVVDKDYAFCCGDIGRASFDVEKRGFNANDWETSALKKYVEARYEAWKSRKKEVEKSAETGVKGFISVTSEQKYFINVNHIVYVKGNAVYIDDFDGSGEFTGMNCDESYEEIVTKIKEATK